MDVPYNDFTASRDASSVIVDSSRRRPRYFDGKFLTASDLTLEQTYILARQADVAKTLGFGIVDGLHVERAEKSVTGIANPAASVTITQGHGLTPTGEMVFLPEARTVDLGNVSRMMALNASFGLAKAPQQPFYNLSGLFVLGLRAVEFTSNPTPVYPPSVSGNNQLQDGEIIEATAITLVPYESEASQLDPAHARARAAREIFLDQQPPKMPAGVLPLAMVYLRGGFVQWVDEWLVRREAGDDDRLGFGFAPRALSEAHFSHYQAIVPGFPSAGGDGLISAKSVVQILPPGGPLPVGVINKVNFTQAFFPAEARVQLALVPEDELPSLMDASLDFPPIDLSLKPEDNDALAILILAPVPRRIYAETWSVLKQLRPVINVVPSRLGQQKPLTALLRLNEVLTTRVRMEAGDPTPSLPTLNANVEGSFADAHWTQVLNRAQQNLWYIRCRNLPDSSELAGKPVPLVRPGLGGNQGIIASLGYDGALAGNFETLPTSNDELRVVTVLAQGGLWGRYAYLRAISDAATHARLATLMASPVVLDNPVIQQGIISSLESASLSSGKPNEDFLQAEKDPRAHALTLELVAKAASEFASVDVVRGLQAVFKVNPSALINPAIITTLGRSQQISKLAQLGLKAPDYPELAKLAEQVETLASTGNESGVRDLLASTQEKIPL